MLDQDSPFLLLAVPAADLKTTAAIKRLRHAFVSCELLPGRAYSEAEIAGRFGLGRAAVRVALTALAAEQWVIPRPRLGWEALPVTGALIGDVIHARRALEPTLARIVLSPSSHASLIGTSRIASALQGSAGSRHSATLAAADRQIMDALAASAGGFLARWLADAWNQSARIVNFFALAGHDYRPLSREGLIEALAVGDRAAATAHIAAVLDAFQTFVTTCLLAAPSSIAMHVPGPTASNTATGANNFAVGSTAKDANGRSGGNTAKSANGRAARATAKGAGNSRSVKPAGSRSGTS